MSPSPKMKYPSQAQTLTVPAAPSKPLSVANPKAFADRADFWSFCSAWSLDPQVPEGYEAMEFRLQKPGEIGLDGGNSIVRDLDSTPKVVLRQAPELTCRWWGTPEFILRLEDSRGHGWAVRTGVGRCGSLSGVEFYDSRKEVMLSEGICDPADEWNFWTGARMSVQKSLLPDTEKQQVLADLVRIEAALVAQPSVPVSIIPADLKINSYIGQPILPWWVHIAEWDGGAYVYSTCGVDGEWDTAGNPGSWGKNRKAAFFTWLGKNTQVFRQDHLDAYYKQFPQDRKGGR
jgi:hypothetical protein